MEGEPGGRDPDDAVARFYDLHPYPPPVADLDEHRARWSEPARRRAEFHLLFPEQAFREDLDVLVAGCGTAQAARHALRWPRGRVVGIDISETSLRHTEDLRHRYELDNLELRQLPIEGVAALDQSFDLIVCTGVLHHLTDPDAGLRALGETLRPDGALHLMVYARYGRLGAEMIQEYGRFLGLGASREEVRDLAAVLAEIPDGHPLAHLLRTSPDFRRVDAFADALLNPRERSYSVPQLLDYLGRNGLAFGRWYRQAPYRPQCGVVADGPHADALAALGEPEQFAAMELLRGTMVRHSFVAHGSDRQRPTVGPLETLFPIRLPDTIAVEEGLPAGAAAVLINRSHTYTDLVLPLGESEKALYETIDSRRSITDVAATAGVDTTPEKLWRFFRRLWWYDQVVFDMALS